MSGDVRALGRPGYHFTNWATTYSCQPELYFEPRTVEEIGKILQYAREKGRKVKVVGMGHSPSDLACTTDYMISLVHFNKVLQVDKEKQQVTVQGGCQIQFLNDFLPTQGLALSSQGTVAELTVAGVISTGTHGTGTKFGTISSMVVGLELMTAGGEVLELSREENEEMFRAACLSLGCLGVILTVTLQCEPAFHLHLHQYPAKLSDVLENLDTYVSASDHFRFFWFPHTEGVICYHSSRTKKEPQSRSSWFWSMFVGFYLLEFLLWISTFVSPLVPLINRLYYRMVYAHPTERVDRSDRIFNFNCLFRQYVMEWSIPRSQTAWVLLELKRWIQESGFPAHFPVEVRFVKGDDLYLSPAYGHDACYINIIMYRPYNKLVEMSKYWNAFEKIVGSVGGRPHWAKDHHYGREDFEKIYPDFGKFCKIREQLDPHGMFLNANLERVFGSVPTPSPSA